MFKKVAALLALVAALALIGFFALGPGIAERGMNRVIDYEPPRVSKRAAALHEDLIAADLHADSLLWKRDLLEKSAQGHVDLPRLIAGNVGLQLFFAVTKSPAGLNYETNEATSDNITLLAIGSLWPQRTWDSLAERALYQADKLARFSARSNGKLRLVTTAADLDAAIAARREDGDVVAAILGIEGAHALDGKAENLERLFDAGYRVLGLAHFFDNEIAGSVHGIERYGLTALGRGVVARAQDMGMLIDIAHASPAAIDDMIERARKPLIFSHGGVKGTCDGNRNLADRHIDAVARSGGLIGIGYWAAAVCGTTPADIARAARYVRDRVGVDHVALGSDFDGAVTTAIDTSELASITQALLDVGFGEDEVRKVMGGNALRLFRTHLPERDEG